MYRNRVGKLITRENAWKTSISDIYQAHIVFKMEGKWFDENYTKIWHPYVNKLLLQILLNDIWTKGLKQILNNQTFKNG